MSNVLSLVTGGADPLVRSRPLAGFLVSARGSYRYSGSGTRASRGPEATPQGVRPTIGADVREWGKYQEHAIFPGAPSFHNIRGYCDTGISTDPPGRHRNPRVPEMACRRAS